MSTSLSPPAGSDAVERGDAHGLRRCRQPCRACWISRPRWRAPKPRWGSFRPRRPPDRAGVPGESFDLAAPGRGRAEVRQPRHPARQGADGQCRQGGSRGGAYVHCGATSQDVIDTGAMLELRAGIDVLLADINRAIAGFAGLARQHRHTPVVARTWLQHALPMPFGLKLAEYAAALHRSKLRLQRVRRETLALQFGGAAGTLAALGDNGLQVAEQLAGSSSCRCPLRPGTPTATASRRRPRFSPSSPAPAARSRATFR